MHSTYFLILSLSLAGPLALSFDKKVAFYKKWKQVFAAMIVPAVFFIVWDIIFTGQAVWNFNEEYITGIRLINIPVEEALFFFVVPYCCTFIYACIRSYFPQLQSGAISRMVLLLLAAGLLAVALTNTGKAYTFYTGIFTAALLLALWAFHSRMPWFNSGAFLVAYAIILLPFLAVNGVLTYLPVVQYNNTENLAIRLGTIPVEDIFYGMLLVGMNVVGYEWLLHKVSRK